MGLASLQMTGIRGLFVQFSDIRDRRVCGFYGLNTYRALENSVFFGFAYDLAAFS